MIDCVRKQMNMVTCLLPSFNTATPAITSHGVKNLLRIFEFFLDPVGSRLAVAGRAAGVVGLLHDAVVLTNPLNADHPLLQSGGVSSAKKDVLE